MSPTPLVLITRPRIEALQLYKTLQLRGYNSIQSPLIQIAPLQQKREEIVLPAQIQGWLFSSANGVLHCLRVFAHESLFFHIWRHQPALAIGEMTAETLEKKGFSHITIANTVNSTGLYQLACQQFSPERGTVLHPGGDTLSCNITEKLQQQGFDARKLTLYKTIPASKFAPHIVESFLNGIITHVTLFSVKTAESFLSLVNKANLQESLEQCTCLCLSQHIANVISTIKWLDVKVAEKPSSEHLIQLLPPPHRLM